MSLTDKITARMNELEAERRANLERAAQVFEETLRSTLSETGSSPSRPGEAPHRVSGRLVNSIVAEVDSANGTAQVGPTVPYAPELLKTRPFYQKTIDECRQALTNILLKGGQ